MSTSDLPLRSLTINLHNYNLVAEGDPSSVVLYNFFKEIKIDFKNMHLLRDINYCIIVKEFEFLGQFWKDDSEEIERI